MVMAINMFYTDYIINIGEIMKSGIYRIYSIATNQSYYGSSRNMMLRFNEHRSVWKRGGGNHKIRELIHKFGVNNFEFQILERCTKEEFECKEKSYIQNDKNNLNVWTNPFSPKNCSLGSNVKPKHHNGRVYTDELRYKQSETLKQYYSIHDGYWLGKSIPDETRKKVSNGLKKYYSENIHPAKGIKRSEETKKKVSEGLKRYYLNNINSRKGKSSKKETNDKA